MPSRLTWALLIVVGLMQAPQSSPQGWPVTGGDPGATRHSPLTQITKDNVARLEPAWSFDTAAANLLRHRRRPARRARCTHRRADHRIWRTWVRRPEGGHRRRRRPVHARVAARRLPRSPDYRRREH